MYMQRTIGLGDYRRRIFVLPTPAAGIKVRTSFRGLRGLGEDSGGGYDITDLGPPVDTSGSTIFNTPTLVANPNIRRPCGNAD